MARFTFKWLLVYVLLASAAVAQAESVVETQKKAEAGNSAAKFDPDEFLRDTSPINVPPTANSSSATAAREITAWFESHKKAEPGDATAQFNLGVMYANGIGVLKDSVEAVKWFRKAAEQGDARAQINLSRMYFNGDGVAKDSTKGVNWLRHAAEQGDARAQTFLGTRYLYGDGVRKDSKEAMKWLHKAAAHGEAAAQYNLGWCFANGEGVPKNYAEAGKWCRKAAEQGLAPAQGYLGAMYSNGLGVPKDTIEGLAWTNLAAASGEEIFIKNRNLDERNLGPEVTLLAQQRSKQILKEIEAKKRAPSSAVPKDSNATIAPTAETPKASGSGAIVSTQGHIVTAAHVVAGASSVKVFTVQGMKNAKVLRIDEANDLAVLKLETGTYLPMPVASSRKVRLGQTVATIGFPNVQLQGFSPKVTRGEISSADGYNDDPRSWQISVPVQTGNSGGPLLDENGNLVGVVVAKLGMKAAAATGDLPQNVNYAVKSSYALALLEPYLGSDAPEPNQGTVKTKFEDMVAKAQQSVVLVLVY